MEILKPFGPPIYKNKLEIDEIEKINSYLNSNLLNDKTKLLAEFQHLIFKSGLFK